MTIHKIDIRHFSFVVAMPQTAPPFLRYSQPIPMKMIKIDRLRFLSIGCAVIAVVTLIGEFSIGQKFDATFFVITMIVLTSALEEIRMQLRDLRDEIGKNQRPAS